MTDADVIFAGWMQTGYSRAVRERQENTEGVCQTFGPRARELFSFFFPSPLPFLCCVFFYSLRACGHPVLTCRLCRAAAERLFGLLVVPSFRQLCKEEPGLCGYRGHVRGSEYRFYLFPPPTSHLSLFFSPPLICFALPLPLPLPRPVLAIITAIHIERLYSLKAIRPRCLRAGCKQSRGASSSRKEKKNFCQERRKSGLPQKKKKKKKKQELYK